MDLILRRIEYASSGLFGELVAVKNKDFACITLEFYKDYEIPLLSSGIYVCKRVLHRVKSVDLPFETFEIEGQDSIFQAGNYASDLFDNKNIIVGGGYGFTLQMNRMVVNSNKQFEKFMRLQAGCEKFTLYVDVSPP